MQRANVTNLMIYMIFEKKQRPQYDKSVFKHT